MAERTIDIIYRFIADTREFEKELKSMRPSEQAQALIPQDYKNIEKQLKGVHAELDRLKKLNRITAEEANKIEKEYLQAAGAVDKMVAAITKARNLQLTISKFPARARSDPLRESYERGQIGQYSRGEAMIALERYGKEKAPMQALAKVYNPGTQVARELGDRLKIARMEMKHFNTEVQQGGNKSRATLEEIGRAVMVKGFSFYGLRMTGASVAQQGQMMSLIGGALSGAVFKGAADYIKNLEGGTETSREWANQMQRVEKSQMRIGAVMADQTLPLLTKGADLLGRLARYIEQNPEQVGMVAKAGLTLAGIGALIIAVGKGITLVADVAFIAATVNMLKGGRDSIIAAGSFRMSANTMLKAATINAGAATKLTIGKYAPLNKLAPVTGPATVLGGAGAGGGAAAAGGGISLAALAASIAGFIGGAFLADKAFDKILGHDQKFGGYIDTFKQVVALAAKDFGDIFEIIGKPFGVPQDLGEQWFKAVRNALFDVEDASLGAADGLSDISDLLRNSLKRDEILKAYEDYRADDLALTRKHLDDKRKIEDDAVDATQKANDKLTDGIRKLNATTSKQLAEATRDYRKQELEDEQQYQRQRAELFKDAGEESIKAEQELQERMRKLRLEYEEREEELLAARDAVGLVKNREKYLRDVSEAQRETNLEQVQRKRDIAQKLADLQAGYEQERKDRLAQYKERVNEIQANAKEQMDELRIQHKEEIREIQINRNNRLRELNIQLVEERKRRLDAFLAQVRDLDATLLGEERIRKQHQDAMLRELDSFLLRYRQGYTNLLNTVANTTAGRQFGGYTNAGLYRLHDGEYVLSPSTTKMLENIVGGQLTQAGIINVARSNSNNVVWNDQRRFDSRLSPADRRQINQDTIQTLSRVVAIG